jgi:putative ABC transport system permease protein
MIVIKSAITRLLRAPRFALLVVMSLSAGMIGVMMVGTVVESLLLRALPYPEPDRLIAIHEQNPSGSLIAVTQQNARDLEAQSDIGIESLSVYAFGTNTVTHASSSFQAMTGTVGSEFFRTLRINPMLGRDFESAAELTQAPNVALISESLWRTRFAASPDAIGATISASDHSVKIIGVVKQSEVFPAGAEIWLPDRLEPLNTSRSGHNFSVIARLKPDAEFAVVQLKLNALAQRWKETYTTAMTTSTFPIQSLRDALTGDHAQILWSTAAAALFLLLIAAMNASNLWLARMLSMSQQTATQLSLGASIRSLSFSLWLQSALLCALALVLALVLGNFLLAYLQPILQGLLPRSEGIALSVSVIWFLALLSIALSWICIALPIRALQKTSLLSEMTQNTRSSTESIGNRRARMGLSAMQTAITVVLLTGSLLLWQSVQGLLAVKPGFKVEGVAVADVALSMDLENGSAKVQRYVRALSAIRAQPGVEHAALTSALPLSQGGGNGTFLKESANTPALANGDIDSLIQRYNSATEDQKGYAEFRVVSADFFAALQIPLISGRGFSDADTFDRQHVAVISQALADASFAGINPIGQRIQFGGMDGDLRTLLIVGVAANVQGFALDAPPEASVYVHLLQRPLHARYATFIATGQLGVSALQRILETELNQRANLPAKVSSMATIRDQSLGLRKPLLASFSGFVAIALLLAALGVYGLTRYNIAQKQTELFVRHSLGASRAKLSWQQLKSALSVQIVAIIIGLALSAFAARLIASQLFGVAAHDAQTLAMSGLMMLLTCTLMALIAIVVGRMQQSWH